ncbi:MAG TPA: OmpA family protein [Hyphomicrobiaceae bacterium]|nr:OmpA family protein [Hyphomicrobiaceae bacterium]
MGLKILRWLWALPMVAVIWWLAFLGERSHIERDLRLRADTALHKAGLGWASSQFTGIDGQVTGRAYSDGEREQAAKIVAGVWGVWQVSNGTDVIGTRERYIWGATRDKDGVRVTGYYPTPKLNREIVEVLGSAFPSGKIHNAMEPARGAPREDVWLSGIRFGASQLPRLKPGGSVILTGTELAVEGEAENPLAYQRIKATLARQMPQGIVLVKDNVTPPTVSPYSWSAQARGNQLVLGGHVPSEAAREALMSAAKAAFPKAAIVDKMGTAAGAPANWPSVARAILSELARLSEGAAQLTGEALDVSGVAVEQATAEAVEARLAALGATYRVHHAIKYRTATVPVVTPFVTSFLRESDRVTLSGYAPDQASIDRLIAAARFGDGKHQVVSTLAIAKGVPDGWRLCTMAGLAGLAKVDTGRVEVVARRLHLTGVTKDEEVGQALPGIVRAAANRACDDLVEIRIDVPPEPDLKWSAKWHDGRLQLEGEVPDSKIKAELGKLAAKSFANAKISDAVRVKPGKSKKWPQVASVLLELLAKLRQGEARIDGQSVVLAGEAPDTAVATAVKSRLSRGLAKGYSGEAKIEIKSAAMLWAEREEQRKKEVLQSTEAAERKALLEREVKEQAAREAAERERKEAEAERRRSEEAKQRDAAARQEALRGKLAAEAKRQTELEAERQRAIEAAQMAAEKERQRVLETRRREQAEAEARAQQVERRNREIAARETAAREAADRAAAQRKAAEDARRIAEARRKSPVSAERKAEGEKCQKSLIDAVARNRIRFGFGSDELLPQSKRTLDRMLDTINRCKDFAIEIQGHTDSLGRASVNQKLSEARANSVKRYLIAGGVAESRMTAVGYGETRPTVVNRGADNRALNRRIEFRVVIN